MKQFLPYIENLPSLNTNQQVEQGYLFGEDAHGKIVTDTNISGKKFGNYSKDVIEFSVYSTTGELLGWKIVEREENYSQKDLSFINNEGVRIEKSVSYLDSVYPTTSTGDIIISPIHEMLSLGLTQGEYKIRTSQRSDLVGSFDNPVKLNLTKISTSRTELKAVPQSLTNSTSPNDISFNFEYTNFIKKEVLVAHIYNETHNLLTDRSFLTELEEKFISGSTTDYDYYVQKISTDFSIDEYRLLSELDSLYKTLYDLYKQTLVSNYNEVFSKQKFLSEYIKCAEYILNSHYRFVGNENSEIKVFYKFMLLQNFDSVELDNIFNERFDKYLTNILNFGNGLSIPFLKYGVSQSTKTDNTHPEIVIKTLEPLPDWVTPDSLFYISSNNHSNDIVQNIIIRPDEIDTSNTYKLRGPNFTQMVTDSSTKKYTMSGEDDGLITEDEDYLTASDFFKTTNKDVSSLNVDYSNFSNFVKFSSARKRIDNFILKITKISSIKVKLRESYERIETLIEQANRGLILQDDADRAILSIRTEDVSSDTTKLKKELQSLTPYEKYLYYENTPDNWPRESSFVISGFTGVASVANGKYKMGATSKYDVDRIFIREINKEWKIVWDSLVEKWKLTNSDESKFIYSNNSNLSGGFTSTDDNNIGFENQESNFSRAYLENEYSNQTAIFPPQLIPSDIKEFKKTNAYFWYLNKAEEAESFDKLNDDSLKNNIPEFLTRSDENKDFTKFLDMIGEHFDILVIYIDSMLHTRTIRNSSQKGVPNNLVWFVMNSFGSRFLGRELGGDGESIDIDRLGGLVVNDRDTIWRRILNNLPYILKTSGTESSIRSLLRCYGVPDYLFNIREFGGVNYNTDSYNEDIKFSLDVYDYRLQFSNENCFMKIPWGSEFNQTIGSLEFRLNVGNELLQNFEKQEQFEDYNDVATLPVNFGSYREILDSEINSDFMEGSMNPRFYEMGNMPPYIPSNWSDDSITLMWENVRENISFSYPNVTKSENLVTMVIYSNEGKLSNGTYNESNILAKITTSDSLNSKIVRLVFNQASESSFGTDFIKDFKFLGTPTGSHYTLEELDTNQLTVKSNFYLPIINSLNWEFGVYHDFDLFQKNYGKFYLKFKNSDGVLMCPELQSDPVFLGDDLLYDILISREDVSDLSNSSISMFVKRVIDGELLFTDNSYKLISRYSSEKFSSDNHITLGSNITNSFRGGLDRLRIYNSPISSNRFLNHINFNEGYDIDNPTQLRDTLLVKVNFDHPFDISQKNNLPGTIYNSTLDEKLRLNLETYNFTKSDYPYDFVGYSRREFANLPAYGAQSFNNNKVRVEKQLLHSPLSPTLRATKKSLDRYSVDTNTLGVYFSPTDIVNREIIRFFGDFPLGDYIGDPRQTNNTSYKDLEKFKKIFYDNGFGRIDIQNYFNLIKSYVDPSLFSNIEKLIPARSNLISGLLIEPSILERPKLSSTKITTEGLVDEQNKKSGERISRILDVNFSGIKNKKGIAEFANKRDYFNDNDDSFVQIHNTEISSYTNDNLFTYDYNYGGMFVNSCLSPKMQDLFAIDGTWSDGKHTYKVEEDFVNLSKTSKFSGNQIDYRSQLSEAIEISGFSSELESANGIYNATFTGQLGKLVFTDEANIWWIFYSSEKSRWVLASDGTVDGAKPLATGTLTDFTSYTWIAGTSEVDTNIPQYFSTGYLNSIPSDNLPNRNSDYFARVEFISAYDRFIEVDAYLQGWINSEIVGEYEGTYISRELISESTTDTKYKNGAYRFYPNNTYYVYLNGNFKGKLQNGWIGSEKINPLKVDDMLKVVGEFNGNYYTSCDNPFFISGNINSHVSSKNRDKLVLNFENYETNRFGVLKNKFKSTNLVKLPNTINESFSIKPCFLGDFKITPRGFQSVPNYERGQYESIVNFRTIERYIQPIIWNYNIEMQIDVTTNSVIEMTPIFYHRNLKLTKSHTDILLGTEKLNLISEKQNDLFVPTSFEVVSSNFNFISGVVYNQDLTVNTRDINNFLYETINDSKYISNIQAIFHQLKLNASDYDFTIKENLESTLNNTNISYCLVIKKINNKQIISLITLSDTKKLTHNINGRNYLSDRNLSVGDKTNNFNPTPVQISGRNQLIKDIDIVRSGKNYTGNEQVIVDGIKPKNWNNKIGWPLVEDKLSDLFDLNEVGEIIGVNKRNSLITGIDWNDLELSTFTSVPLISIKNKDGSVDTNGAILKCVTGEPTPYIKIDCGITNINDLTLGNTIGKKFENGNISEDTFIKLPSTLKYEVSLLQNKELNIQTTDDVNKTVRQNTEVLIFTQDSISSFQFNLKSVIENLFRCEFDEECFPADADTYEVKVLPFLQENGNPQSDISYTIGESISDRFFLIFNNKELENEELFLDDEDYVNKLSKKYNNKISRGYIEITGFYGDVILANGIYKISQDTMYAEDSKGVKNPISVYLNENKKWVIYYELENNKWKLEKLNTDEDTKEFYINSNTQKLSDGFTATSDNNKGFYKGTEVYLQDSHTIEKTGIVKNETGKIIGTLFQTANVNIINNFNIIPNQFYFRDTTNRQGNFLMWRIIATSLKNKNISYEVPVVYINSSSKSKNLLSMYDAIYEKLETLRLKQSTESDECTSVISNSMFWGSSVSSNTFGMISDEKEIPCFGQTFLDVKSKLNSEYEGKYLLNSSGIDHTENNNCKFVYEDTTSVWKIINLESNELYRLSGLYPKPGTYRSNTKNIIGYVEFSKIETSTDIAIVVSNFTSEYATANGEYVLRKILDSGNMLYQNDTGWVFKKKDGEWLIQDSYKYPTKLISLIESIDQTGVYVEQSTNKELFVNFKLQLEIEDNRSFIGTDIENVEITGKSGNIEMYSFDEIKLSRVDFPVLQVSIDCVSIFYETEHEYKIPIQTQQTYEDFYKHLNSFFKIESNLNNDSLQFAIEIPNTRSTKKQLISKNLLVNPNMITPDVILDESSCVYENKDLFSNTWSFAKTYKKSDVVTYSSTWFIAIKNVPIALNPKSDSLKDEYWREIDNRNRQKINVSCKVYINGSQESVVIKTNTHNKKSTQPFVHSFDTESEVNNGVILNILYDEKIDYSTQRLYKSHDIADIGGNRKVLSTGSFPFHINKHNRRYNKLSSNDYNSTVDISGYTNQTPPIVRTPSEDIDEIKLSNSFWFNTDTSLQNSDSDEQTEYVKPSHEAIVKFDFEKFQTADSIYFIVSGFVSRELSVANGTYNPTNNKLNDGIIYKNENGWYIFNESDYWVLANNVEATENELENFEFTTSNSSKTPSQFNGNFGSSNLFNDELGDVQLNFIFRTPTPTPTETPTPTPTPTPTYEDHDDGGDSPDDPISAFTPTPTPVLVPTPTPSEIITLSSTPTPSTLPIEDLIAVKYGEFAISKKQYDLSINPSKTEQEIIDEFAKQGIEIEGLLTLEEMIATSAYPENFLLTIINLQHINIKIKNYDKLVSNELRLNKLSKYGWNSEGTLSIGTFRSFYLSLNAKGRIHNYDGNQSPPISDNTMYIKSWMGPRPCFIKLKPDVTSITNFSVTNGRYDGIMIKWNPATNSNYVNIETSTDATTWSVLASNVSNSNSYGFLDTITPRGILTYFRIISYGNMDSQTTSMIKTGWRLGFPSAPTKVRASTNYLNRIHVTWTEPSNQTQYSEVESYNVYRSKLLDENNRPLPRTFTTYEKIASNITDTSFMDRGEVGEPLQVDTPYFYIIESKNEATSYILEEEYDQLNISSYPNSNPGGLLGLNLPDFNFIVEDEDQNE